MLAVNTVLQNRYRIVHQLGQGGMGAVYLAIDERLNKTVAIKEVIFEPETSADENRRDLIQKAFQREANSLVKAKHEAVPDITDFFSELEKSFLVMEYVGGDDLAKMLEKRGKPFSFEEVLPWINQLLEALKYLHNLTPPILHRDIKPQNLKLNERQKIKLLDFGIARSSDKTATISPNTFLAATLNYAPFEQVLRVIAPTFREFILLKHRDKAEKFLAQDTDARCDVFGVGATFYHLLTNQVPADVTGRALGIWEKGRDELANPSEINPEIPQSVSEWILKAMAFERENRFSSASEMQAALEKITPGNKAEFPAFGRLEEAMIAREQQLMQAKTESFINPAKTEEESFQPGKYPSATDSAAQFGATDAFTPAEFALTDFNTDFSTQATSDNLADRSFVNEKPLIQQPEKRNDEIRPPQTEKPANNNRKYILILAVMGILVLAVSGIGLYVVVSLMNNDNPPKESKSALENTNLSQTPETTPSVKENVSVTTANTETNTETNSQGNTKTNTEIPTETTPGTTPTTVRKETPKPTTTALPPTVTPTSKIIVEQTPKATPTAKPTVNRTPSPQKGIKYVMCYVKSEDGTTKQVRKDKCSECPAKTACELIF